MQPFENPDSAENTKAIDFSTRKESANLEIKK
jgi:hypothetical protein